MPSQKHGLQQLLNLETFTLLIDEKSKWGYNIIEGLWMENAEISRPALRAQKGVFQNGNPSQKETKFP